MTARHTLAIAHGAFDLVSGLWPIVHYSSFIAVTGPKREPWLVKTVGAVLASVGATLLLGGIRRRVPRELKTLAITTTGSLAAIDLVYAGVRRRISPVYLADAAIELAWTFAWARAGFDEADANTGDHARREEQRSWQPAPAEIW